MNSVTNFLSAGVAFPSFSFLFHFPAWTLPMGLEAALLCTCNPKKWAEPQTTRHLWKVWARWLSRCLAFHQLSGSITQWRAEPFLYDAVPCQEIWGPCLCGRNHPFFSRKMLFFGNLFPPGWSLCLVILTQEAPWGVQPLDIHHPVQWAELLLPSAQGEEHVFSLWSSSRLYCNKREGGTIKGISIRKPVSLGYCCARAQGLQKTLQIWSLLRSPELPSGVAFLSPLTGSWETGLRIQLREEAKTGIYEHPYSFPISSRHLEAVDRDERMEQKS